MKTIFSRFACAIEAFKVSEHVGELKTKLKRLDTHNLSLHQPINYSVLEVALSQFAFCGTFPLYTSESEAKTEISAKLGLMIAKIIEERATFKTDHESQQTYRMRGVCKVAIVTPEDWEET